jgi:hypothetical protein
MLIHADTKEEADDIADKVIDELEGKVVIEGYQGIFTDGLIGDVLELDEKGEVKEDA